MKRAIPSCLRSRLLAAVLGGVVVAAAGSIAWAAIPDSGGVIHGCYKTSNGDLRVIDPGAGDSCRAREVALDWGQFGPTAEVLRTAMGAQVELGGTSSAVALCHGDERVISGGVAVISESGLVDRWAVKWSFPAESVSPGNVVGWSGAIQNNDTAGYVKAFVEVLCAKK